MKAQVSHVIKATEVPKKYAKGTIRISLGKDNSEDDVNVIINVLVSVLA